MKKSILILLLFFSIIFVNAQQEFDKTDVGELLEQAKTNFKNIKGEKKSEKDGLILYACTHKSVLGEFGDILEDTKAGTAEYSMFVKYNSTIEDFKIALEEYVEAKFPEPNYLIFHDDDDGFEQVTVMSDIKNPDNPRKNYMIYTVDTDPKTGQKTFELVIFGLLSAQKSTDKK